MFEYFPVVEKHPSYKYSANSVFFYCMFFYLFTEEMVSKSNEIAVDPLLTGSVCDQVCCESFLVYNYF